LLITFLVSFDEYFPIKKPRLSPGVSYIEMFYNLEMIKQTAGSCINLYLNFQDSEMHFLFIERLYVLQQRYDFN